MSVSLAFAPIDPLAITAFTATCAAGRGNAALDAALQSRTSGLVPNDFSTQPLECWIGRVAGLESVVLPPDLYAWTSRNQQLAWLGLQQDDFLTRAASIREKYGPTRIAVVVGTSTSSIGETERAYRELDNQGRFQVEQRDSNVHHPHSLGAFVQAAIDVSGPCLTIATACSSSAKVFASAERLIRSGFADAVIVGGVDTLCDSVLFGFNSLGLISAEKCRPFDTNRSGLSLGEAAGFAILERIPQSDNVDNYASFANAPQLIGYGESSDAHHMSAPHPQGLGAQYAVEGALARASLSADQVDYINLHGTASRQNDDVEAALVARLFSERTRASSTKGWSGHTLGAAGILEAVITLIALRTGFIPGTLNTEVLDPVCGPQIMLENISAADASGEPKPQLRAARIALSNSFGFGGNNCCLAFARGGLT